MKKKLLSAIMAGAMVMSLGACGGKNDNSATEKGAGQDDGSSMQVAMITDSGDITDQSFNQTTYETCKAWASGNDVEFNYYKPESDSDEARNSSVDQAIADGANVIVLPGYTYNTDDYDVTDYYNKDNVYCCTYQEELSGYMAGYAAVKLGYRHFGFLGGMSVPAVTRFGYGYVQGADEAANELGITNEVSVEYVCGGQFYGDADITAYMDTWYGGKGVETVFACGGGIYTSAAEAAVKTGGKVIGVDSDQSGIIDTFAEGLTITSAMKGLAPTVETVLTAIKAGNWKDYVGKIDNLGLVSDNPEENFVQLPMDTTQWGDGFTQDDYKELVKKMYSGEITVSSDITAMPKTTITVNDYGSIK